MTNLTQHATDIRVLSARAIFDVVTARTAFSFGNAVASTITRCHVRVDVENRRGERATGWGAIFLSHPWAVPGPEPAGEVKDAFMRRLVERICEQVAGTGTFQHPVDLFWEVHSGWQPLAEQVAREAGFTLPPPALATLVCASPVDAAVHDAFGKVNGISSYDGYSRDLCAHDLSAYLGPGFRHRYIAEYLRPIPAEQVLVAHTVGGLDPLTVDEVPANLPDDGLPRSLDRWIARDRVRAFKVKLHGDDLEQDLARLIAVHRVAQEQGTLGLTPHLSVDLNEQCTSADYAREYLDRLAADSVDTYAALDFVEQPAPRDMTAFPIDVAAIAASKPVMLDEGLTSIADLERAKSLGWNAVALKTCKCQSLMLLALAWAAQQGMLVTVQDLSNPGLALLQSVSLAARLPAVMPMEANARQFFPAASEPEAAAHPGVFHAHDGAMETESLLGPGFGHQTGQIARPLFHEDWPDLS